MSPPDQAAATQLAPGAAPPDTTLVQRRRPSLRVAALGLALGLAGAGWVALVMWNASPHARYLDHEGLGHSGLGLGPLAAVFVAGWVLMLVAMMLPSTYPLLLTFERAVADDQRRARLLALVVGGYLAIWTAVGLVALAADLVLHEVEHAVPAIGDNGALVVAGVLAVAGAFQFSPLKYRCLDKCRSPLGFFMTHWHGRRPAVESLRLGWAHGWSCIGCCWALMAVMFAVGHGNLAWMLLLGAVMTAEKVLPLGRRLAHPTGVVLLAAAVITALQGSQHVGHGVVS